MPAQRWQTFRFLFSGLLQLKLCVPPFEVRAVTSRPLRTTTLVGFGDAVGLWLTAVCAAQGTASSATETKESKNERMNDLSDGVSSEAHHGHSVPLCRSARLSVRSASAPSLAPY